MRSFRIHIEEIFNGRSGRRTLHQEFQDLPTGMTPEKLIRFMLEKAGEKFQERTEPARHD